MDDDVAGIDEHPIASGNTFDARRRARRFLDLLRELISDCSDVTIGAPRRDDHKVTKR